MARELARTQTLATVMNIQYPNAAPTPEDDLRYARPLDNAPVAAWMTDAKGACIYHNGKWDQLFGNAARGSGGQWFGKIIHPDDAGRVRQEFLAASGARSVCFMRYRLRMLCGDYRWFIDTAHPRFAGDGSFLGYVGTLVDSQQVCNVEQELYFSKERFRAAINAVEGVMWTADAQGNIVEPQPQWEALTGQSFEEYRGHGWANVIHPDDMEKFFEKANASFENYVPFENAEHRLRRADGAWRLYSVRATQVRNEDGSVRELVGIHTDITERREYEQRIEYLASHDALTGLPNRVMFHSRLEHLLAQRGSRRHAVLFMDLNRFKPINDCLGHAVGDRLLVEVAQRLRGNVRAGDTVSRFGGDEFVLLLEGIQDENDVIGLAHKLLAIVAAPVRTGGHVLEVTASIGIGIYPGDADTPAALLKHADLAMYRAKAAGGNTFSRLGD